MAIVAQKIAPNEAKDDYLLAIKYYQNVLNTKQDINVLTDMATAAFYSGQNDLAEKSFKEVLASKRAKKSEPNYVLTFKEILKHC